MKYTTTDKSTCLQLKIIEKWYCGDGGDDDDNDLNHCM